MFDLVFTETQRLAEAARQGLRMVTEGEDKTIEGWLIYGRALNEGRKLFPSDDRAFGRWVTSTNLIEVHAMDQAAAIWAASDEATFEAARRLHPRVRTVRGLHAKWKEAQRPEAGPKPTFEEPTEADLRRMDMLRNTINHPSTETHLRANAQRKLNDYLERFGQTDEPKPRQQAQPRTKQQLADAITHLAMQKAASNTKAFSILSFAINHLYGSEEQMERVLGQLKML